MYIYIYINTHKYDQSFKLAVLPRNCDQHQQGFCPCLIHEVQGGCDSGMSGVKPIGKAQENHGKIIRKWWFNMVLMGFYVEISHLVNVYETNWTDPLCKRFNFNMVYR